MACPSCNKRRDMLKNAAAAVRAKKPRKAVRLVVETGRHFVHNPPKLGGFKQGTAK